MAPLSVGQTFALAMSARGGHPAGNEATLIGDLRTRLSHPSATDSEVACRVALAHGLSLVVAYLQRSHADSSSWDARYLGDYCYELMKIAVYRTRLMKKYAKLIDSDSQWALVEQALLRALSGTMPPAPVTAVSSPATPASAPTAFWWCSKLFIALDLLILAMLCFYFGPVLCDTGRCRLKYAALGTTFLGFTFVYILHGPSRADWARRGYFLTDSDEPEEPDDDGADTESQPATERSERGAGAPSAPNAGLPEEIAQLRRDLDELKMSGSPVPAPVPADPSPAPPTAPMGPVSCPGG